MPRKPMNPNGEPITQSPATAPTKP
jgi:hypothetical protein